MDDGKVKLGRLMIVIHGERNRPCKTQIDMKLLPQLTERRRPVWKRAGKQTDDLLIIKLQVPKIEFGRC
jgi:hypothetical protein